MGYNPLYQQREVAEPAFAKEDAVRSERDHWTPPGYANNHPAAPEPTDREQTFAEQQHQDYLKRWAPLMERYLAEATDEAKLDEMLGRISINTSQSFTAANQNANQRMQSFGIARTAGEQRSYARQTELQQALSNAQSRNAARQHFADRRTELLTGAPSGQGDF